MTSLLIRSGALVEADDRREVDVLIEKGNILSIAAPTRDQSTQRSLGEGRKSDIRNGDVLDAKHLLLFPLLIDCHVHFREPGMEYKATMETEAASGLAGGVGMVCEMPNTIPPTVTIAALADKVRRAERLTGMRMKFFFGVTEAAHLLTLKELWTGDAYELKRLKHHCCGVKLYLDHSTGDQKVESGIVEEVFKTCAQLQIPLVAHCEDAEVNAVEGGRCLPAGQAGKVEGDVSAHSNMRPPESEAKAIEYAIGLVRKYKTPFHIAHLSTQQGIELVRRAKAEELPVTCEVAPHHLFLTTDDYPLLGTLGKMNPPLRSAEHQSALWGGIADRTVDCIATDHAPHTLEEKRAGDPLSAPSGVPGIETMLPLLLSVASGHWPHPHLPLSPVHFPLSYSDILRLCFTNPNSIFSLHQEGMKKDAPARLMLIDPNKEWTLKGTEMHGKCAWTPFEGWEVVGNVQRIFS